MLKNFVHALSFCEITVLCGLQNLLELVANEMAGDNCQADAGLVAFYNNTLAHIAAQKAKPEKASLYDSLQV